MQIFRLIVFSMSLLVVPGCNSDQGIKKKYLLDREVLINVLIDINLANALQGSPEYYKISRVYDSIDTNSMIFSKYGIEKASFDSTLAYYAKKPEILTSIYDEVIMHLNQIQDSIKIDK
jgi:hypothetical protein